MNLQTTHDNLQADCLLRLKGLQGLLESISRRVQADAWVLNDLGELQGVANILDCRIASLATVRRLLREETSNNDG